MYKCINLRNSFIWTVGALLSIAFVPHAHSSMYEESSTSTIDPCALITPELPRPAPIQVGANLNILDELIKHLEVLEESDTPATIVATLQEGTLAAATELPIDISLGDISEIKPETHLAINSEAPEQCRAIGVERSAYNYGAVAEAECTCELYQRNPASKFSNATAQEFHWVKSCKKSRYKAS